MVSTHDSRWADLIDGILDPVAAGDTAVSAALRAALAMTGADAAQLVEWVQGRPSPVARIGASVALVSRPRPGVADLAGRPLLTARVDAYRDLVVNRGSHATAFNARERENLQAIARLLSHSAAVGRKDATATLDRISREIVGSRDVDRVLLTIAQAAGHLLSSEISGVLLVRGVRPERQLHMRSVVGHRTIEMVRLQVRTGQGIVGAVLETERPARADGHDPDAAPTRLLATPAAEQAQSGIAVPFFAEGALIGVLAAWRRRPSTYSDEDEALLISLAGLASIGLVNARLFQEQQRATRAVETARAELERKLAAADESLNIHRRLTEIAAEGLDLVAVAEAVHAIVGGPVVIAPDGDRPSVRFPLDLPEEPSERTSQPLHEAVDAEAPRRGRHEWVRVPIEVAGERHGVLYGRLPDMPTTRDAFTLEQSATICALLLGHETSLEASTARLRTEFVWDLLEGRRPSAGRAAALGLRPVYPARVLLLQATGLNELARRESWSAQRHENNRAWLAARIATTLAERCGHVVPVATREEQIVAIAPAAIATDAAKLGEVLSARSPFPSITLELGVSADVPDAAAFPNAYREATIAASAAAAGPAAGVAFDDLGVLQFMVGPGGSTQLRRYAERVLGPLLDYDRTHGTQLVPTLDAYFEHGCNSAGAARHLQLHTKSLTYRLRRIGEISGLDLADRAVRLDLELALRVLGTGGTSPSSGYSEDGERKAASG